MITFRCLVLTSLVFALQAELVPAQNPDKQSKAAPKNAGAKTAAPKQQTAAVPGDENLKGQAIILRTEKANIKVRDEAVADGKDVYYPLVVRHVNGPWLWITTRKGSGWVKRSDALTGEEAIPYFTKLIQKNSKDYDSLWRRSVAFGYLGKFDEQMADLDVLIKEKPTSLSYTSRAATKILKKLYEEALKDLEEAIKLDEKNAMAYNNRGMAYFEQRDLEKAIPEFTLALKLLPKYQNALVNRGSCYEMLGSYAEAKADYTEAIEADTEFPIAYNNRAWLLATCPVEEIRDAKLALEDGKKACELTNNGNPAFLDTLAAAHANSGDFAKAVEIEELALSKLAKDAAPREEMEARVVLFKAKQAYRLKMPDKLKKAE